MSKFKDEINEILADMQGGNSAAKETLFERTYAYLKLVAWRYLRDKNGIEDVLQCAYLRVFAHIDSFDKTRDGYNWLCKIVQNEALRYNESNPPTLPLPEPETQKERDVDAPIVEKMALYAYLQDYSKTDQQLLYYRFYEQMSFAEIAQKLGMKKSTVHKRVSKLLKDLLAKIKETP